MCHIRLNLTHASTYSSTHAVSWCGRPRGLLEEGIHSLPCSGATRSISMHPNDYFFPGTWDVSSGHFSRRARTSARLQFLFVPRAWAWFRVNTCVPYAWALASRWSGGGPCSSPLPKGSTDGVPAQRSEVRQTTKQECHFRPSQGGAGAQRSLTAGRDPEHGTGRWRLPSCLVVVSSVHFRYLLLSFAL